MNNVFHFSTEKKISNNFYGFVFISPKYFKQKAEHQILKVNKYV